MDLDILPGMSYFHRNVKVVVVYRFWALTSLSGGEFMDDDQGVSRLLPLQVDFVFFFLLLLLFLFLTGRGETSQNGT